MPDQKVYILSQGIQTCIDEEGTLIRLACIIVVFLALGMIGAALAENAADEEAVDSGTMDLVTVVSGTLYTAEQSVNGTGFADVYKNLAVVDPDDQSQVLNLKVLDSGTGYYSHNSLITVINNTVMNPYGEFESSNHRITAKEDTSAVYAPISINFPGSFKVKTVKSLWKDQTHSKNYAGMISMDSLLDNAKTLNTQTTTDLYSDEHKYPEYLEAINSTTGSSMDITSKFDGSAHIGATYSDVRGGIDGGIGGNVKSKAEDNVLMDEDYKGSFDITKKMAFTLKKTTDYGDYEANYEGEYEDYPWLPCTCNAGWDEMAIHDTRYHSAKGFFDCTTCLPPAPCKN